MKKNLLVTLADENYIDQAKQLFSSVYWNAGWRGDYMLLAYEIPEHKLKWFRDKRILIKKCKPITNFKAGNFPSSVFSKFNLFTTYFKRWQNIIFLDSDIIVNMPLNDLKKVSGFAAVQDLLHPTLISQFKNIKKNQLKIFKKNYNVKSAAMNTGVMAFNTGIISKTDFSKLIETFEKYKGTTPFGEQGFLNLFFYDKWKKLPIVYNIFPHLIPKKYKNEMAIFHFAGIKPWNSKSHFYGIWKSNLKKADLIDLKNPIIKKSKMKKRILNQSKKLRMLIIFYYPVSCFNLTLDRFIGKIGIVLKKISPKIYCKLKK